MKLAIISHTEHYTTPDGTLVGWSPTVNEINHLLEVFDSIVHLAMYHEGPAPKSVMAYASDRIQFVPLPSLGGPKLGDKLKVLWQAPSVIRTVSKVLQDVDYFQLRTPTGIGVFLIPYLTLFVKSPGWFKYAGNWNQAQPPLGYRLQRWLLKRQNRKVTINGQWPSQPKHCLSFENPCLSRNDLELGKAVVKHKHIEVGKVTLCFVGRLEAAKGIHVFLEALLLLPKAFQEKIETIHLVGEGPMRNRYELMLDDCPFSVKFYGVLERQAVHDIYKSSHFLVLPSASEGFPKVVSEAINYGCVPIVSDISSISQYLTNGEHAFLLPDIKVDTLVETLEQVLDLPDVTYQCMVQASQPLLEQFTYDHYNKRILNDLL